MPKTFNNNVDFTGTQYASLRAVTDQWYLDNQKRLFEAYYNYWSLGQSKPETFTNEIIINVLGTERTFLIGSVKIVRTLDNLTFEQYTVAKNKLVKILDKLRIKVNAFINNTKYSDYLNRDISKEREEKIILEKTIQWLNDELTNTQMLNLKTVYQNLTSKTIEEEINEQDTDL